MQRISWFTSITCLLFLFTTTAGAQDDAAADAATVLSRDTIVVTSPRQMAREISEDLEIFRRILQQAVGELYSARSSKWSLSSAADTADPYNGPLGLHDSVLRITRLDAPSGPQTEPLATWIPGRGVMFQIESSPLWASVPQTEQRQSAECPFMSQPLWKRTQMELSGEARQIDCRKCHGGTSLSAAEPNNPNVSLPYPLADVKGDFKLKIASESRRNAPTREELLERVLGLLAENGRNFRHLGGSDTVTVAFTFREMPLRETTAVEPYRPNGSSSSAAKPNKPRRTEGAEGAMTAFAQGGDSLSAGSDRRLAEEIEGDLAARSKEWQRAGQAYGQALVKLRQLEGVEIRNPGNKGWNWEIRATPAHREEVLRILTKCIQAKIGAGDLEVAQQLLEATSRFIAADATEQRPNQAASLPVRLVISVEMSALLKIAKREISRDEFRKQVRVQLIDPTGTTPTAEPRSK